MMLSMLFLLPSLALSFPYAPPQLRLQQTQGKELYTQSHNSNSQEPLLPTCSSLTFGSPCQCPAGTKYETTTTYAVIGANAKDVQALTGSFFNIEWLGMMPEKTAGPDNSIGSTRTDFVRTMKGGYEFVEEVSHNEDEFFLPLTLGC